MRFASMAVLVLLSCLELAMGQAPQSSDAQLQNIADELNRMRQAMSAQQQQILEEHRKMAQQQEEIEKLRSQLAVLQNATTASTQAAPSQVVDAALRTAVKTPEGAVQESAPAKESPLSFRIGGTEFTPGGFFDFENVFRTTNSGSVITTNFGAIPFSNTPQGQVTENRTTAQFSRFNLKVTGKYGATDVTAYAEMDFNGNDVNNVFAVANSHTFRERLAWADIRRHKWEFMGGQTWSWVTPNRRGVGPMPSDLALTYDEDGNAQVGIPYTRAAELRVVYHPNDRWAAGVAIENAEQYTGFGGNGEVAFPNAFAVQLTSQFDPANANATAPSLMPDILSKIAYDKEFQGKHFHAELNGLLTSIKTAVQPTPGAHFQENSTLGGGFGGAFNVELVKNFRVLANAFYSDGGGRYVIGLGPSAVVRPDGTPSLVHSGTGLVGIEYQPTPKTLFGAYYGAAYFQRNFFADTSAGGAGKPIGFGGPGSPGTNNKSIQEPTFDWTQTFWHHPQYGEVRLVTQTSYLTRSPWFVAPNQPKNAHLMMVYTSLRYVLP